MDLQSYISEIKLQLTGGVLQLELTDEQLTQVVYSALREIQRYIATTQLITLPYQSCIDLSEFHPSSVSGVYRSEGYFMGTSKDNTTVPADPMYMAQWQMLSPYGMGAASGQWVQNMAAWNTTLQIKNTLSTDLAWRFERHTNKLYINCAFDHPGNITIEYVPQYRDVKDITSDYWIDMLLRLAVAQTKIIVGRIRSRYTQSNALWAQDGDKLLEEGNTELTDLREKMRVSTQLTYGYD